jgi:putative ABC transport system permease protein
MVLVQGIRPAVLGIALGAAGAYAGSRVLQSLLYNVTPADPLTLVSVTVLLLAVVVAAILLPAGRASRISPMNALKVD